MALQTTPSCKECGWSCKSCSDQTNLHLHVEIENLKQRLLEREHHIVTMETNFLAEAEKFPNGEYAALTEELLMWQDKYSRLYESYKRVQKVNQNLEDKLLKIVDKCETEKNSLLREVATLTQRLADSKGKINRLQSENERYRNDVNLAIQLLQCKPNNFVPQRYDSLPADLQQKVLSYVCGKRRTAESSVTPVRLEMKTIKVPIPSSPPASMVYSVNKSANESDESNDEMAETSQPQIDSVSAAIMAKVLEERERERQLMKHCESCQCCSSVFPGHDSPVKKDCETAVQVDMPCLWCGQSADLDKTVIEATNRSSQGLVRYVDVVTTRTCEPIVRNGPGKLNESCVTASNGGNTVSGISRLGVKIESNGFSASISNDQSSVTTVSLKSSPLPVMNGLSPSGKSSNTCFGGELKDGKGTAVVSCDSSLIEAQGTKTNDSLRLEGSCQQNCTKFDLSNTRSNQNSSIGFQVLGSDKKNDVCLGMKIIKDVSKRNSTDHNKATNCQSKNSSESSAMKIKNRENKSYLIDDQNKTTSLAWARYPIDSAKKVPPSDKFASQVPLPGIVKPTETSISKLHFASSIKAKEKNSDGSTSTGPRLCSMRVQAGSSNILLDNATSYEPVLYTSKSVYQDSSKLWNVNCTRAGTAVLVHTSRSHLLPAEDLQHKNDAGASLKSTQRLCDSSPETEI